MAGAVGFLAWSNPVSWWWGLLTLVSGVNIAVWFVLYRELPVQPTGAAGSTSGIGMMLLFCAAYVFGCAFRSFLPRADVQRICLFDTWLSSVMVGRSVATVAEIAFVAQWAILLHQLGTMTGAETVVNAAWVIVPLILIAECLSWYAVLTRNYLGNAIENSLWAVAFFIIGVGLCRLLPEFDGVVRVILAISIVGIAGYLAFLMTIDVPMYLKRWRTGDADGDKRLTPREGSARCPDALGRDARHRRVEGRDGLDGALFQPCGLVEPGVVRFLFDGTSSAAVPHRHGHRKRDERRAGCRHPAVTAACAETLRRIPRCLPV